MGLRTAWRARVQQWEREAEEAEAAAEKAAEAAHAAAHAAASAEALAAFAELQRSERERFAELQRSERKRAAEWRHLNETIPENIPTIGPATLALLRRESLRSRRDLLHRSFDSLKEVHGVGPGRASILFEWAEQPPDLTDASGPQEEYYVASASPSVTYHTPLRWLELRRVHPLVALVANALASTAVLLGLVGMFVGSLPVSENIIVGLLFVASGGLLFTPWWKTRMLGFGARFGLIALSVGLAAAALAVIEKLNRH
jgi:hypothetical protein